MKRIISAFLALIMSATVVFSASALSTSASSAILMDKATGAILYASNENSRRGMASTTKIMTAVVVLEKADMNSICKISNADANTEGSALGLSKGDEISVKNLLVGLMLVSGNDAANVLAKKVAGSVKAFADMMNMKAEELGMNNTHFTNPSGLPDNNHYSSAYDMAVLTSYALSNKEFSKICASKSATITFKKPSQSVEIYNHNRLLSSYKGCIGVKTGYTQSAGRCLVSAAKRGTATLIAVTLGDGDDWRDHKKMFDYGFSKYVNYDYDESKIEIEVTGSTVKKISVGEKAETPLSIPKIIKENIVVEVNAPRFLYAPIKKGETVGNIVYRFNGNVIAKSELVSKSEAPMITVKKGFFQRIIDFLKGK